MWRSYLVEATTEEDISDQDTDSSEDGDSANLPFESPGQAIAAGHVRL
jgi:hypothetical protein